MNDYGAAGTIGNLYAESGIDPQNLQDSFENPLGFSNLSYTNSVDGGYYDNFAKDKAGYGIAQWTYWSRKESLLKHAKSCGKSIGDLEMQLSFLAKELKSSYPTLMEILKSADSVEEVTLEFLMRYERPENMRSKKLQNDRVSIARDFYD